jgi:hypothetical protein
MDTDFVPFPGAMFVGDDEWSGYMARSFVMSLCDDFDASGRKMRVWYMERHAATDREEGNKLAQAVGVISFGGKPLDEFRDCANTCTLYGRF